MNRVIMHAAQLCAILAAPVAVLAGDLNPPAGPIAPTMKPLSELEPRIAINATNTPGDADSTYRISNPGSYYLTGLLLVGPGKMGIEIANDDITIDLNGYRIGGIAGTLDGIRATGSNRRNIRIRNGIIAHCQGNGINFESETQTWARGCAVENVTVADCTLDGLRLGKYSIAEGVTATGNGQDGIYAARGCTIRGCTAGANSGAGIWATYDSVVSDCSSSENLGSGIGAGDSLISDCTASGNGEYGICVFQTCVVRNCMAQRNEWSGIWVDVGNTIVGNTCAFNGDESAGIFVFNRQNRIESNNCLENGFGIKVRGQGNFLVKNTCSENDVNWSIWGGNTYGPILDRRIPNVGPIEGNAAGSTLETTDPNANFTYGWSP